EFNRVQVPTFRQGSEMTDFILAKLESDSSSVPPPVSEPVTPPEPPKPAVRTAGERMVKTVNGIEYAFRWCPAGSFLMGSSKSEWDAAGIDWKSYNETQHSVTLTRGFWMLETEVTQAMWKSVMGTDPSHFKGAQNPVEEVSWEECRSFCEKLSEKLGLTVSLPTEAQWEYACRAGTTSAYAGDLGEMGWYGSNSGRKTHPVGQKKPNAWGLYDMHGNVWEWCQDWYDEDYYTESPTSDPCNEDSGSDRVYRGGGWNDLAQDCRSASRGRFTPDVRYDGLGFRIVLAAPAASISEPVPPPGPTEESTPETTQLSESSGSFHTAGERMVKTVNGIEYAFRWCPAGTFTMGSPSSEPDRYSDETQHSVTLTRGFWMLETEVTQAMWKSVMGTYPSYFKGAQNPVECVSWDDCQEFCRKLSSKLNEEVSLPTEAQWEYACRAGTTGAYAGDLSEMGWYDSNSGSKTHPVGQKKPNAWGLYDMHGNVWEWCQDWYGSYSTSPTSDPCNLDSSDWDRVCCGGSWSSNARRCRSASRGRSAPDDRDNDLGFRPVLASPVPEE
ncbi:MAG: formylglycine-generating enzyme family protein, partial [Planctomycetaceae bacterium]|nr:formylglycine-generating enzyme family protein [Planctomycetaceae bacterium]